MHIDSTLIYVCYIVAAFFFIIGIKRLSSPATARQGNTLSAVGMLLGVIVTLLQEKIISYQWITSGVIIGSLIGVLASRLVAMTQMPQMIALFNGFGGLASLLVAWSVYHTETNLKLYSLISITLSVFIGSVTFTGSLTAWGKLSGLLSGKPLNFKGQQVMNLLFFLSALATSAGFMLMPEYGYKLFLSFMLISLFFGFLSVLPIGGADMPVIISLLNSYSGLAASAAGFVINNTLLIVAGALVGASGIILTNIMCKAMHRSLPHVLFGSFGKTGSSVQVEGSVSEITVKDAFLMLEAARSVVIVPGYGMAVAQAQHALQELSSLLAQNGCEVVYAIHPVAGRMPGHMNVLLAEAHVDYDQLVEMDAINPTMPAVDVALVIGANDVVNTAARDEQGSPIHGMPIIEVDKAKIVFVLKRSLSPGFSGVVNPLFYKENTRMLFGDAKSSLAGIIAEFKDL